MPRNYSKVHFGTVPVGDVPRVVGTLSSSDSLVSFAINRHTPCDVVEVRLDKMNHAGQGWLAGCRRIEAAGLPVLLTVRLRSEGGEWDRADAARLELFKMAMEHVSGVDVELNSQVVSEVCTLARALNRPAVVSFHDFQRTPGLGELRDVLARGVALGSVVKIATTVNTERDLETLQQLLQCDRPVPLCVIGMGALGAKTRTQFPALGSCLTYGYLDKPVVAGQLAAGVLVEQLRATLPEYDRDFARRLAGG